MTSSPHPATAGGSVILFSENAAESREFYRAAFGWGCDEAWMTACGVRVAWIRPDDRSDVPRHCWVPTFVVRDPAVTRHLVLRSGGGALDVLREGRTRWAVLSDSEGVAFAVSDGDTSPGDQPVGGLGFVDLYSRAVPAALRLYGSALGLRPVDEPVDGPGEYHLLVAKRRPVAGILGMDDFLPPSVAPYWLPYFRVDDLGPEVARLVELGARVRVPSTDTSLGAFAVLTDPQGIAFGLQTRASDTLLRSLSAAVSPHVRGDGRAAESRTHAYPRPE
ncbi:VOC family protein [Streptomyces torulosus]|uniref:VOC family protein n=1 Tax=Streptomyces torulosus TaxID=68276 RepID=UPI0006EBD518|nr:VOC family protein [Streptomyces torulosus]